MTVVRLLAVVALLPIPVGVGPRFHPPAAAHGACHTGSLAAGQRVHLELFALRRVAIVPAAIGVRGPRLRFGRVIAAHCHAAVWTLDPSGVVSFTGTAWLGDVFRVWGQPISAGRLLGFRGGVRLYRNGRHVGGDPQRLLLRDGDELVLEVGGYVPPHRSFRFPR